MEVHKCLHNFVYFLLYLNSLTKLVSFELGNLVNQRCVYSALPEAMGKKINRTSAFFLPSLKNVEKSRSEESPGHFKVPKIWVGCRTNGPKPTYNISCRTRERVCWRRKIKKCFRGLVKKYFRTSGADVIKNFRNCITILLSKEAF